MKVYHFVLLFAVFAIGTIMVTDMRLSEKRYGEREKAGLSEKLERAAEAAAGELASYNEEKGELAEQRAIEAFFYSMYASLGIIDMPQAVSDLKKYVPLFMIGVRDGYYLYTYAGEADFDIPEDTDGITGPDGTGYIKSGLIAYEDGSDEHDTVFAAYLRDYPLRTESYSGYCFSSASVTERTGYIVDQEGIYHLSGCPYSGDTVYVFFSEEGCIMMGALPCSYCIERRGHDE